MMYFFIGWKLGEEITENIIKLLIFLMGLLFLVARGTFKLLRFVLTHLWRVLRPYAFRFLKWLGAQVCIWSRRGVRAAYAQCIRLWDTQFKNTNRNWHTNDGPRVRDW